MSHLPPRYMIYRAEFLPRTNNPYELISRARSSLVTPDGLGVKRKAVSILALWVTDAGESMCSGEPVT